MTGKVFGYARISTLDQNLDRQFDVLKEYGIFKNDVYADKMSGSKIDRPALTELQKVLRPGDTVVVESLSRVSRSTKDLLQIIQGWQSKGITFISLKERLDFSSTTGKLMLTLMAALSEFERDVLRDRVSEGLASARARGRIGGRPRTDKQKVARAVKLYNSRNCSVREIVEMTGVSESVLYRALKQKGVS